MALVLDPVLASAQEGLSRKPIVEIISTQTVPDIPFDGQFLMTTATNEQSPNVITHSSGRLCGVYTFGNAFKYFYTDYDRQEFFFVDIALPANFVGVEATICELPNGNIGIIYYGTYLGLEKLRRVILSPTGTVISEAEIGNWGSTHHLMGSPFVTRLLDDTYIVVFVHKDKDASTYTIGKKTSLDFLTWSAESPCLIGGLDAAKRVGNPSLLQISTGETWIWFDYLNDLSGNDELINIYFSTSDDEGLTWAAATKFTNYTTYDTVGRHPVGLQKIADQIHLLFYEQRGSLHLDSSGLGYCGGIAACPPSNMSFDSAHRKLYVVSSNCSAGWKTLYCVFRIDIDTWTIDACWNSATVPNFDPIFTGGSIGNVLWGQNHGEMHLIPIGLEATAGQIHVDLLDGEADTITHFHFSACPEKGIAKNVAWGDVGGVGDPFLASTWVDYGTMRLYCVITRTYTYNRTFHLGYFDLTQTGVPDPGDGTLVYAFTDVIKEVNKVSDVEMMGLGAGGGGMVQILPGADLVIVSMAQDYAGTLWNGRMRVYTLSTPSLYKEYQWATNPSFPYHGIKKFQYVGGKIYGGFKYDTIYQEAEKRGLCIIDLASDSIIFQRPTWATIDDYLLSPMVQTSDSKLIMASYGHGITIYDLSTGLWTLFDNSNVAGMDPGASYQFLQVAYDEDTGLIFTGPDGYTGVWSGVIAFSIYGFLRQAVYQIGDYTPGSDWAWGAADPLVQGLLDYEAVVALDPGDQTMYAFWTEQAKTELSLKWDKEGSSLNLSPYIVHGQEITHTRTVDGTPSGLGFTVTDGYLFDPHNSGSLYSIYLRKGRKLTLRMGENVGGVDYWQEKGKFYVKATSLTYEREQYPLMKVEAEDIRCLWEEATVLATGYYQTTPKEVIEDLLTVHGGLTPATDLNVPVFDGSATIYHQWVEVALKEIIDQIANRFSYFVRTQADGKISCRKISDQNAVDHTYSGRTWMINFSPDDSHARTINQVMVMGKSRDYIDVLFNEEAIQSYSGTVGWWGGKKTIDAWYSVDHTRTCRNPRLEVVQSVRTFNFRLGGGGEEITSVRADDLGCTITINLPQMVPVVIALLATIITIGYLALPCDRASTFGGGYCGLVIFLLTTLISLLMNTVCSMANYQYQLYAQPCGKVQQTLQGTYNDLANQAEVGMIIPAKIDDALCYGVDQCNAVAAQAGMVARLQRNRVTLTKVAHLQDEEGDTIQFNHPKSDLPLKVFITNITTKMQIPASPESNDGYFLDQIEGWKL